MERQTKIIATLGPACASEQAIDELVAAGMDVARLNFSHGDYAGHRRLAEWVHEAARTRDRAVALLQDIQGPKIRVGTFPGGEVTLEPGQDLVIRQGSDQASPGEVWIDYHHLLDDVEVGEQVAMADGLIRLEVTAKDPDALRARVIQGGVLGDHKGVAFPQTELRVPAVTDKDRRDIEFGAELEVDLVAASFVRSGGDVRQVKELVGETPVIAKIELAAAYERLDEILIEAHGAMVARGDLGVQLPLERLPLVQQDILQRTNTAGRISIVATEMLESMIASPRPSRAEVTDVASAVMGGADAVMLSGETAAGRYPTRTVEVMDVIAREIESGPQHIPRPDVAFLTNERPVPSATAKAAVEAASDLGLDTIVAFTETGTTARLISKYRPAARIVAFTPEPSTYRRMALYWGVRPARFDRLDSTDEMIAAAEKQLLTEGICKEGQGVVMVAGVPPNQRSSTNLIKLHVIGEGGVGVPRR
jgi:pyruvate kinase